MAVLMIMFGCLCWILSGITLFRRPLLGPVLSFAGLWLVSLAKRDGLQYIPVNGVMLTGWLAITVVVSVTIMLQSPEIRMQSRGVGYMLVGAVTGLAVSMCGNFVTANPSMVNGFMIIGTAAGTFLGYLLFTRTPDGMGVGFRTGNFFRYLLAKGFPVAVSVMMLGLVVVLLILRTQSSII